MNKTYPISNPMIVYREEFDNCAILFDPDSNETYALDEIGCFIWKMINGRNNVDDIVENLKKECEDELSTEVSMHVKDFIEDLEKYGLVGYEKCR